MENDWSKRHSDRQLQEGAVATRDHQLLLWERQSMSLAHLMLPASLQAKQLCHFHAQLSLGLSCHRQKKSCIYVHRVTLVVSDSL